MLGIDDRQKRAKTAVKALGGGGKVARWLHLPPQTVYSWLRSPAGVPCEYVPDLIGMSRMLNPPVAIGPGDIRPDVAWHKLIDRGA